MLLRVAQAVANEVVTNLSLEDRGSNEVVVTDGTWDFITFRVEEGRLVFARNEGVDEPNVNTDEDGRIVEVREFAE